MDLENNISSTPISAPSPSVDLTGKWKNQLNSEMTLIMDGNGKLTGKYATAVGRPSGSEEFELMGVVTGDLVSFIVNFGKYGSLTAWAGQVIEDNGKETIRTLWHLSENVKESEESNKVWGSIRAGYGLFTRTV